MRSRVLHTIFQFLKRDMEKVSLFLEKRYGEKEVEKLKVMAHHLHAGMYFFLLVKLMHPSNFAKPHDTVTSAL